MIRFSIGYQPEDELGRPFTEMAAEFCSSLYEVYFAWPGIANGRISGFDDGQLAPALRDIAALGLRLDLLVNAGCYGMEGVTKTFMQQLASSIDRIRQAAGRLDVITTTSRAVATYLKRNFPEIEVRASVNMRIGNTRMLDYLAEEFDSFYLQREYNYNPDVLQSFGQWCRRNDRRFYLLANSGCMNWCAGQSFHDNLLGHYRPIPPEELLENFDPTLCGEYYRNGRNAVNLLKNSWIRPEDVDRFENLCDGMKLATRASARPRMIVQAYVKRSWHGNLLDLLEPGLAGKFLPEILDNTRFPADWVSRKRACGGNCDECRYCETLMKQVMTKLTI